MALQGSGQISLGDIATEFGGTAPHSLSEYYGKGNAPASGEIQLAADFYGTANASPIVATGGTVTTSGDYKYHKFTSSGTFTVSDAGVNSGGIEYVLVAGGAGATTRHSGGGGGGGVVHHPSKSVTAQGYSIVIGAGGNAGARDSTAPGNGANSTAFGATALGGGRPGAYNILGFGDTFGAGNSGGSGGGAQGRIGNSGGNGNQPSQSGDSGTYGHGYAGGSDLGGSCCAGMGGGGGGGVGESTNASYGGDGGIGYYAANFTSFGESGYFGGGGGGAGASHDPPNSTFGIGGNGGGGNGGDSPGTDPQAGTANTGGGAGGNRDWNVTRAGGSGIVIIRYKYQNL